jgi:hypothetical protein
MNEKPDLLGYAQNQINHPQKAFHLTNITISTNHQKLTLQRFI